MTSPKVFLASVTRTRISLVGTVITTVSAIMFLSILAAELLLGFHGGPYLGILAFIVIPSLFLVGLLLIPLGLWLDRRRRRKAGESDIDKVDLSSTATRAKMRVFIVATLVNVAILMVATFKGVEVMGTNEFCGQACHKVMLPEFTTYQRSAHARVRCVECHIGAGASWFVKSKLSGAWQLVAVSLEIYPRPIPTPIHNLRPARETCEQCHWPTKFVGDRLKVISRFKEDEANTETKTVMVVKVGGRELSKSHGIHWHTDPGHVVRYRSDPSRENIYEVEVTEGEKVRRFVGPEADKPEAKDGVWRTMDCVDCHNRPAHVFLPPEDELDRALAANKLDRTLPFLRREGLRVLNKEYPTQEAARAGIAEDLAAFYRKDYPAVESAKVEAAGKTLGDIWATNVFPTMDIKWGTYKSQAGHVVNMGCMRCHNGDHKADDGAIITGDCESCHVVLADAEENPEILKALSP